MKKKRQSRVRRSIHGPHLESDIQSLIKTSLERIGIVVNRVNTGTGKISDAYGERRLQCNSISGKADLEAWVSIVLESGYEIGVTYYIEVKSKQGKQRTTQKNFESLIGRTSSKYIIARSIDDVMNSFCDFDEEIKREIPGARLKCGRLSKLERRTNVK